MIEPAADTIDGFLDGRLQLRQPAGGHRSGTDAILLAAAAAADADEVFIDVGAGVGAVGLAVALAQPGCRGILLEADVATAALARDNITRNDLDARVGVACVDLFDSRSCRSHGLAGTASLVVTNPPFYRASEVRASVDPGRVQAHVLGPDTADHGDWLVRAATLLRPGGRLLIIHRATALPSLLKASEGRLGSLVLRAIHPREGAVAHRILLGGTGGARGPLTILPPLMLHGVDGTFTQEGAELHRGAPMTFWPQKNRPRRAGSLSDRVA